LLSLDSSKIPSVLDMLQHEVKTTDLDHQHSRKCIKLLQLLVNKHHILPPSLFLMGVSLASRHILAAGGFSKLMCLCRTYTFEGKSVCVKVLRMYIQDGEENKNNLREFYKETLVWNRLNHSNILPFLGVSTALFTGKVALVSPWMVNGSITSFLKLKPRHDRLRVISEIVAGIMYLHSHNIVHGDIKGV
ncbi:kinase-like protein, partial [Marasmius fiardii PR-910]